MSIAKTPDQQKNAEVGSAVAESSCQNVVPLFPVRYSVAPKSDESGDEAFSYCSDTLDKTFKPLDKSQYTLRSLRPESYVYIYNENSENKLTCFIYSKIIGNTNSPRFYYMIKDGNEFIPHKGVPQDYIWLENKTGKMPKSVRIGCTKAQISHRIWDSLKSNSAVRKKLMPTEVLLQPWLDSCKQAQQEYKKVEELDPKTRSLIHISELEKEVLDFSEDDQLSWSEYDKTELASGMVKASMQIANPKLQLVIALQDPLGLASELNHIAANESAGIAQYTKKKEHQITSARMISDYLKNIDSKEVVKTKIATEREALKKRLKQQTPHSYVPMQYGVHQAQQHQQTLENAKVQRNKLIEDRYQRALPKVEEGVRNSLKTEKARMLKHLTASESGLNASIMEYEKTLKQMDVTVIKMIDDCLLWVDSRKPAYVYIDNALCFYDGIHDKPECHTDEPYLLNAYSYESAILHLYKALNLAKNGKDSLKLEIQKEPNDSNYWRALAKGDKALWESLQKPIGFTDSIVNFFSKATEYGFHPFNTEKLVSLAVPLFMEGDGIKIYSGKQHMLRATIVSRYQEVMRPVIHTMPEHILSEYSLSWEVDGEKKRQGKSRSTKKAQSKVDNMVKEAIAAKVAAGATNEVKFLSWEATKVGGKTLKLPTSITHTHFNPAQNPLNQTIKFIGSDKVGGSVAGAVSILALFDLHKNVSNFNTSNSKLKQILPLASSILGLTSGILALSEIAIKNFERTGRYKFQRNSVMTHARTGAAANALKFSVIAGALASTIATIQDGGKAIASYQSGDTDSANWRLGATSMGVIATGAGFGAGAAVGALGAGIKGLAIVGLLGPVGWIALGILAVGAWIYFNNKADKATDSPIEIWLKRSYWGHEHNHDLITEMATMRAVFYRPSVSATWNDDFNDADKLEVTIFLPQYQPGKSVLEVEHSATLGSKKLLAAPQLKQVAEGDGSESYYHYNKQVLESGEGYALYKLIITLDDDAKANISILYFPNQEDHPNLKIEGSATGKTWEFEDDWAFGNTIDTDEFKRIEDK